MNFHSFSFLFVLTVECNSNLYNSNNYVNRTDFLVHSDLLVDTGTRNYMKNFERCEFT